MVGIPLMLLLGDMFASSYSTRTTYDKHEISLHLLHGRVEDEHVATQLAIN